MRGKGTIGGNVANGDPGNDMPALMQCLDAGFVLAGPKRRAHSGRARILPGRLHDGARSRRDADRDPDSGAARRHGYAYEKLKRKVGDYATAAAAVVLTMAGGRVATASIALTNVGRHRCSPPMPARSSRDRHSTPRRSKRAAAAAKAIADPATDGRGTAEYRREMAGVMVARALAKAAAAREGGLRWRTRTPWLSA